jgi:hypothetical protein
VESEGRRKVLAASFQRLPQRGADVLGSDPNEMNRRKELGSAALPGGKKERAGLSRCTHCGRHAQRRLRRWCSREHRLESIGYANAHGHALESAREVFQPRPRSFLVREPDHLTPRGAKTILKSPDGIGLARDAKGPGRLGCPRE